jgi:hypothetical protein
LANVTAGPCVNAFKIAEGSGRDQVSGQLADLPVEPDRGVEREQVLHRTYPQPGRDPAARTVQTELVLHDCGPDIAASTRKPRRDVTARAARLPVSAWMGSWTS